MTMLNPLQDAVRRLARERNAVILAHNYQVPEIQDVADFVGDSLGLAIEARKTDAPVIVMCGVYFMAETAKIVNPERIVLSPDPTAGCSLADSITLRDLRRWKGEHPGAVVVSYVNTTAEIKAESDYCVTSGNAEAVVRSVPLDREILFLPDQFLGAWLKERTGRQSARCSIGRSCTTTISTGTATRMAVLGARGAAAIPGARDRYAARFGIVWHSFLRAAVRQNLLHYIRCSATITITPRTAIITKPTRS